MSNTWCALVFLTITVSASPPYVLDVKGVPVSNDSLMPSNYKVACVTDTSQEHGVDVLEC